MTKKKLSHTEHIPYSWAQIKHGEWIRSSIQCRLDEWVPRLFANRLLKVGGLSNEMYTQKSPVEEQFCVDRLHPERDITADSLALPFIEKSFGLILLNHQLDYTDSPHEMLREVNRVITDDGYLIISGFNPLSLSKIAKMMPMLARSEHHKAILYSMQRIQDWLQLLNYDIVYMEQYRIFSFSSNNIGWILEQLCKTWLSHMGGMYFIVAKKQTYPIHRQLTKSRLQSLLPIYSQTREMRPSRESVEIHAPQAEK